MIEIGPDVAWLVAGCAAVFGVLWAIVHIAHPDATHVATLNPALRQAPPSQETQP